MKSCRHCEEFNPPRARYCMGCGVALAARVRSEQVRRATVLFADIVGSTAVMAGTAIEQAAEVFSSHIRTVRSAIRQYDGVVTRVEGDGVMALFGAPVAAEDHARRACLAGLHMQSEFARRHAASLSSHTGPIRLRVGISTGQVLLREVASDLHVEYSAEGVITHFARKAEKAAAPGRVVITAEVARSADGFFELRTAPPLAIDGLPEPLPVFEVVRPTDAKGRFQVSLARGLTELVGRESELAHLEHEAASADRGKTRCVAVVGEAGVGKSRMLWEFRGRLVERGWSVHAAHATVSGARSALFPVLALLRSAYAIDSSEDADTVRAKLARVEHPTPTDAELSQAALLVLLGLAAGDVRWDALDPEQRADWTRRALVAALLATARHRPTALVIDDLHDADEESLEFLDHFARRASDARLLLLLERRPEQRTAAVSTPPLVTLEVEPLTPTLATALFRRLAGSHESIASLERALVARVAGNPFFIEEGVRLLFDSGVLSGPAGDCRATAGSAELPIPGSVKDIIEARIDRLELAERNVLELAAVYGHGLPLSILRVVLDIDLADLGAAIARLVDVGLLAGTDAGGGALAFKHAVTQEVAYGTIRHSRRRMLHERIVGLLEKQSVQQLAERTELLAHHSLRAENWDRAVAHCHQAARRATERSAAREALRLLEDGLTAVSRLPAGTGAADREIDLRLELRGPLVALGRVTRLSDEVLRLEALATACVDIARLGRLAVFISGHCWFSGKHVRAVEAGRRAIELASRAGDFSLIVPARQYLGGSLLELGEFGEAEAMLSANATDVAEDSPGHPYGLAAYPAVVARSARGWVREQQARFAEAEADARDAMRIALAASHGFSILSATFTLASIQLARGCHADAETMLANALERCIAERQRMWPPVLGSMRALALARIGRTEAASEQIDRAVPRPDAPVLTTYMALTVAQVYALVGRSADASRLIDATLKRTRRDGERPWEAQALLIQADLARRRGDESIATEALEEAITLALRLDMPLVAARCRLALAARDSSAAAEASAHAAAAEIRALGADYWAAAPDVSPGNTS